jgi:hypothetical protein
MEVDNIASLKKYEVIAEKVKDQLSKKEGLRDGIFELLKQLKDCQLIRNLPSENRKRGINASKIVDDDVKRDILNTRTTNKEHIKRAGTIKQYVMGQEISGINLSIDDDSNDFDGKKRNREESGVDRANEYYEGMDHLRGSRVRTGHDLKLQHEQTMQYYDSVLLDKSINDNDDNDDNDENMKKKIKLDPWNNNENKDEIHDNKDNDSEEEEDIDWES